MASFNYTHHIIYVCNFSVAAILMLPKILITAAPITFNAISELNGLVYRVFIEFHHDIFRYLIATVFEFWPCFGTSRDELI